MSEKKFKLFDFNKDGKGVSKYEDDGPPNIVGFFKQYKRKFSRLISVNIFMVLGCFPLFFYGFYLAGYGANEVAVQSNILFPAIDAFSNLAPSPVTASLTNVYGISGYFTFNTVVSYIFYALTFLILFTWGPMNVGTSYIMRNLCKGDPVFMWSDFWYAIKRNVKQGIIIGIIDLIAIYLFVFNVGFYYARIANGTFLAGIMFYASLAMLIIYFYMRFYMYILLVTFDLSIFKILKNSLIFSIIGFKRNFMATLGILALIVLNFMLFLFIQPLGIVMPLVLTIANCAFMATYAAWFKIKEIMIDPYAEESDEDSEAPIAVDDVTE